MKLNENSQSGQALFSGFAAQIKRIIPTALVISVMAVGSVGLLILISEKTYTPLWLLTREASEAMYFPAYIGILSNLGGLTWMATTTICLFTAMLLHRSTTSFETKMFILSAGLLSLVITVDDMFRLHDQILLGLFGIREGFFYLLYLLTIMAFLGIFRRQIFQRDYLLLVAALLFFFLSRQMFIDIPYLDGSYASGDILKYFGNMFWLAFFYRVAFQELSVLLATKRAE
ncbi:MAG TPA: hypothetical protein PK414_13125 [Anaerolineales bacterium]|nr:hypothetical protein [Anaerolineales bacterium]